MKRNGSIWEVVRLVAPKLGIKPEQIRLWKHRGRVPGVWQMKIAEAAAKDHERMLTSKDFAA